MRNCSIFPYRDASVEPTGGGDRSQVGIPGLDAFNLLNWRGGSGAHVDFSPVCRADRT